MRLIAPFARLAASSGGTGQYYYPAFSAPLTSSLTPDSGYGTYTFARASTATILDHEGVIQNCYSGEARFLNARRVVNLLKTANAKSADLTDGVWAKWLASETINSATQYTETVGSANAGLYAPGVYSGDANGRTFRVSFTAYRVSGTSFSYMVRLVNNGGTNVTSSTITLTASARRYSVLLTIPDAGTSVDLYFRASVVDTGRVISLTDILIEDVTHQTNQNPANHVSFGMGDDHGCNEDGVKYFAAENGNTVDGSFVVTEASGAALTDTGYLSSQERTNTAWPSNDISHANWTKNNVTPGASTTLIAGLVAQEMLSDSTTDEIHSVQRLHATGTANGDMALSFFVATGTAGFAFIRATKTADTDLATQWFNLTTGAVASNTDVGSVNIQVDTARITAVKGGYLAEVVIDGSSVVGNHTIECGLCSADGSVTMSAAGIGEVLGTVAGFCFCNDHEMGQYIPTLTGTVTTAADVLGYSAVNIPAGDWAFTGEIDLFAPPTSQAAIFTLEDLGQNTGIYVALTSAGQLKVEIWDSTVTLMYKVLTTALAAGTHKIGFTYSLTSGQRAVVVNGVEYAPSIDTDSDTTTINEIAISGYPQSGGGQVGSPLRNVHIYNTGLTVAQLQALTS